ncbi:MAG: hypothetical protein IID40_06235 [Planctomycetes bacterium]|nr:hypothetical protein [Planctomycetota bacterium]
MDQALSGCLECHDQPDEDEGLAKIFGYLDEIAEAQRTYVATARRLDEMGQGIVLVDNHRFLFEDAKTHLNDLTGRPHLIVDDTELPSGEAY